MAPLDGDHDGLLPPSGRAANGYRTHTAVDVARLQRVLSWRELGFDLDQLRRQHTQLVTRIERLQAVAATVQKTLEAHEMGINLTAEEMLEVFGDDDPTEHVEEARKRWGDTDAYRESQRRASSYSKDDWLAIKAEGRQVDEAFLSALDAGLAPDSREAAAAATAHREHISSRF